MGMLDDLAMGFGMKDRDQAYYDRTAKTIANNDGAEAAARYNQWLGGDKRQLGQGNMVTRGGPLQAFSGMFGGGGDQPAANRIGGQAKKMGIIPRLLGYRDDADFYDGGGAFAFGGPRQGGILSMFANAVSPMAGERTLYPSAEEIDARLIELGGGKITPEQLAPYSLQQKMDAFRKYTQQGWGQ